MTYHLNAWVDESMRSAGVIAPMYLLGASIASLTAYDDAAEVLRSYAPPHMKLHWRDLGDAGRRQVSQAIPMLGLTHVVVVGTPLTEAGQERARGKCFERLLWELDQLSVERVIFESRSSAQDKRDKKRVDGLRSRTGIRPAMRVDWQRGETDPLLWAPDIVIGALGDAKAGLLPLSEDVARLITEVSIDL